MRNRTYNFLDAVTKILLIICVFFVGYYANDVMDYYSYQSTVAGLHVSDVTEQRLNEITDSYSEYGDWICVDVRGMDYRDALEVCKHEVGHEIFAEECEDNIDKCFEVVQS